MRETSGDGAARATGAHRARGLAVTARERRVTAALPPPDLADPGPPGSVDARPLVADRPAAGPFPADSLAADPWPATEGRPGAARRLIPASRARLILLVSSITAVLIVGAVAVLVFGSNNAGADTAANRDHALAGLRAADGRLQSAIQAFRAKTSACGQDLACITGLDARVARAFASFRSGLTAAAVPAHFAAAVTALTAETNAAAADFRRLAAARSTETYLDVETGLGLQATLGRWESAVGGLETQLTAGR
jgi:hypothetical protein